MEDTGYRVVWELHNHIVGKVYALDQKNMNAMIRDIEAMTKRIQQLGQFIRDREERIEQLVMDVSNLKVQNDKYREALENISTLGNMFDEKASAQVAREALKGEE